MSAKLVLTPILISLPVRRVLLIGGYMKQEITIVIKSEDGELLDMRELVSTYLHSDEGVELVRACVRQELTSLTTFLIGGDDERH